MKYYYIAHEKSRGFYEVTKEEFIAHRKHRAEVNTYVEQVKSGGITLADIPETHRAEVEAKLAPTLEEKAQAYDIIVGTEG